MRTSDSVCKDLNSVLVFKSFYTLLIIEILIMNFLSAVYFTILLNTYIFVLHNMFVLHIKDKS